MELSTSFVIAIGSAFGEWWWTTCDACVAHSYQLVACHVRSDVAAMESFFAPARGHPCHSDSSELLN